MPTAKDRVPRGRRTRPARPRLDVTISSLGPVYRIVLHTRAAQRWVDFRERRPLFQERRDVIYAPEDDAYIWGAVMRDEGLKVAGPRWPAPAGDG